MWASLLNQTLDYIKSYTIDGYGSKTTTTLHTDIMCRWQEKFERVLDKDGLEVVTKIQCWLLPTHNDEDITLDTGYEFVYNSNTYTVVAYTYHYGLTGEHEFTKVYLR